MKSSDHFSHQKLSEVDIAKLAYDFRSAFGVSEKAYIDIIEILEFRVPEFIEGFRLVVRRDIELSASAETTITPPRIFVRETIYDAACEGDHESRRILAHELGHLLLHNEIKGTMQRNRNGYTKPFMHMNALESSEDQADIFARNFLVPVFIAYKNRRDASYLSKLSGVPVNISQAAITISKRQEMISLRHLAPVLDSGVGAAVK